MNETNETVQGSVTVTEAQPEKKGFWNGLGEFLRYAITVIVVVVLFRVFIAQPFVVSGTSMVPTFQNANYLIVDQLSYRFSEPKRGDVVVFRPTYDIGIYLIKRVIGLPGETVAIKNGKVIITNSEHPDGFVLDEPYVNVGSVSDEPAVTVTPGTFFVMGDNRPVSYDSRRWGLLPEKNIAGRALIRLFPVSGFGLFPGEYHSYETASK